MKWSVDMASGQMKVRCWSGSNSPADIAEKVTQLIERHPTLRSKVQLIVDPSTREAVPDANHFYNLWVEDVDDVALMDLLAQALPTGGIRPQV